MSADLRLSYVHLHRVRYRECDPMGIMYHTHYLDVFEAARTEALRKFGLAYKTLEEAGFFLTVIDLAVRYRKPCLYDELLSVHTTFSMPSSTRLPIHYEVTGSDDDRIRVSGHVTLCCIDAIKRRPISPPDLLLSVIQREISRQNP